MISVGDIIQTHTSWRLPGFVLRPFERLLHEREINTLLRAGEGLSSREFLQYVLRELNVRLCVHYTYPLSSRERYIFVANHPFGALDGMLLADMLLEQWNEVGVVVNDLLMYIKPLRALWIPVSKYGRHSIDESTMYHTAMASSRQILTFPAGLCSRLVKGRVLDLAWHPRFVRDAERYDRCVVPIYVQGELSQRFYHIYRMRRAMGISLNIELLLLVDELFAQRGCEVKVVVGRPIDVTSLKGSINERCAAIRDQVYNLTQK